MPHRLTPTWFAGDCGAITLNSRYTGPLSAISSRGKSKCWRGGTMSTHYQPGSRIGILHTYGGLGFYTYGYGIDYAIDQGSLVSMIKNAGIPDSIATYLLCGGANDILTIHNEHTGPSDGVVFIASCTDTTGIGNAADVVVMNHLNHLELGWAESAMAQIYNWLQ